MGIFAFLGQNHIEIFSFLEVANPFAHSYIGDSHLLVLGECYLNGFLGTVS